MDVRHKEVRRQERLHRGALGSRHGEAEASFMKHQPVVQPIADANRAFGTKALHVGPLGLRLVLGIQHGQLQGKAMELCPGAAVGISGDDMEGEASRQSLEPRRCLP